MATERQLQFRVGVLVTVALSICIGLVVCFGDVQHLWKKSYPLVVQLDSGTGLYPTAPVLLCGLNIGTVKQVELDKQGRGVNVIVDIQEGIDFPRDTRAVVTRSLLGESAIEFVRGTDSEILKPGSRLPGQTAVDPLVMVQRLEARTTDSLSAFSETSQEWRNVARNLNQLMETRRGNLTEIVENAAESLHQFTATMKTANQLIATINKVAADPASQQAVRETLTGLPKLVTTTKATVDETRLAVASSRQMIDSLNRNLVNLSQVTEPLGQRGDEVVSKVDSVLGKMDAFLTELNHFAKEVNQQDGTLHKFIADPTLHNQLVRSTESANVLLKNLDPILRDLREFSDKIARNPEVLGLGGAVRPSKGLKDAEMRSQTHNGVSPKTIVRGNNPE